MHAITLILLVIAALAFAGATVGAVTRVNLVALGLFALTLTLLIPAL